MRFSRLTIPTAALSLAVLTGCAGPASTPAETTAPPAAEGPSATPEPTASATPSETADPEPEALIISTAGLDAVKLDARVPDGLDFATWDPDFCSEDVGAFAPVGAKYEGQSDYVIRTKEFDEKSKVRSIIVFSEDILTPSGVHVGMSLKEVKAILPEMKHVSDDGAGRGLYVVKDDLGQLVFEFAEGDELKDIKTVSNSEEPYGIWFTDGGGPCPV